MKHLLQVGAGSGGMPVLDMLAADSRITRVTLIEPDIYKPHNVERHLFPPSALGEPKAETARRWLLERRPDLDVKIFVCPVEDAGAHGQIAQAAADCDMGVCAADNEVAKHHFDELMRRSGKPWTLGEVLSGGIGGFVHWFRPGGPCYACVASYLQRSVQVEKDKAPDYSQPGGPVAETTIPAPKAAIGAIAALHAVITLGLLDDPAGYNPGFTSLLFTLQRVPEVFEEAFRPFRFRIPRAADCLICGRGATPAGGGSSAGDLDVALDQALARLGDA
ncbi:MAG TPA: ThiF family adenylyltransferase [Gemmataceae bacterium]|nr:ThiF family adenylyltransferase [Gemmataceae bacterium]